VDVEYAYGALVAHALLGNAHDLLVVVREGDALHGRRELPHEETLARLHGPEPHLVVRGSGNEEARLCCVCEMTASWGRSGCGGGGRQGKDRSRTIDIYRPNGPVVAIVRSETLAIVREPDVDDVVF
jgi:hypothetical protein